MNGNELYVIRDVSRRVYRKVARHDAHGAVGRYSFGYPACPNLGDKKQPLALLRAEEIADEDQLELEPEQSTLTIVVHHPQAKYSQCNGRCLRVTSSGRGAQDP